MTINDLKTFDVVEFKNGDVSIVVRDRADKEDYFVDIVSCCGTTRWDELSHYEENLKHYRDNQLDVVRVRRSCNATHIPTKDNYKRMPVIWEGNEAKEMTVAEISKALGYDVKIVK